MADRDVMSMDISDLQDLQKDMEQAVRKIPGIAEKRMGKATLIVERQAKINATSYPKVRTGRLRADITPEVTSIKGEVTGIVGNEVIYAPYQELGTRYMEPRRYLQRALEDKEDEVYAELDGVLEEVETIITALAVLEATIAGIKKAHDNVPGGLNELPAFVNYPKSGRLHFSAGGAGQSDHTIICELRYSKGISGEADKKLRPFIKLFRDKLAANLTISGTVDTVNDIRYDYGILPPIGGEEHMGVRFEVDVKETEAITVSA